jgi:hypothetical protein
VSASVIQVDLTGTGPSLDATVGSPRHFLNVDQGIDDPVNDTGLGVRRGDLQMSDELNCFLRMIFNDSGEKS